MQVKEDPEAAMNIKQAETMLGTLRFVQAVSLYHFGPTGCITGECNTLQHCAQFTAVNVHLHFCCTNKSITTHIGARPHPKTCFHFSFFRQEGFGGLCCALPLIEVNSAQGRAIIRHF